MRQPNPLLHGRKELLHSCSNESWKMYKRGSVGKKVFLLLLSLALIGAISGCAGKSSLDVGGAKIDYSKMEVYSSEIKGKVKKSSQNYEKNKVHKALVGEPLVSKIKGYVQKCKALSNTNAGKYVTQKGKEYEIRYEHAEDDGLFVHVDCQGNYSECGVGYYKIDNEGSILSKHPYYDYYGNWHVVNDLSIKNNANQTVEKGTKIFEPLVSIRYSKDAYKTEIIYSGVDSESLKMEYKKYTSYFTEPSSQQSLSYILSNEDNIVAFKDYKIKIVEATNQYVKYVVLSD